MFIAISCCSPASFTAKSDKRVHTVLNHVSGPSMCTHLLANSVDCLQPYNAPGILHISTASEHTLRTQKQQLTNIINHDQQSHKDHRHARFHTNILRLRLHLR